MATDKSLTRDTPPNPAELAREAEVIRLAMRMNEQESDRGDEN